MKPHFTVVIPTRERVDTLRSSLQTCLGQDYPHLRIVVSDNASNDGTDALLAELCDRHGDRIEYIRTPERVSMSENYEFALQHALRTTRGESYFTVLGDDDGLLPRGFEYWSRVIDDYPAVRAFSWPLCNYSWPNCLDSALPNVLSTPLEREVRVVDLPDRRREFGTFTTAYTDLVRLYYGLVRSDALREVERNGALIHSPIPDVYLGFALSFLLDRMVVAPYPLSVVGASQHSTGHLQITGGKSRTSKSTNDWFFRERNLPPHPVVGRLPSSVRMCELEALCHLSDQGFPVPEIDPVRFLDAATREAAQLPSEKARELVEHLREIAERNHWPTRVFEEISLWTGGETRPAGDVTPAPITLDPATNRIRLEGNRFAIEDVESAANLLGLLLGYGNAEASLALALMERSRPDPRPKPSDAELRDLLVGFRDAARSTRKAVRGLLRSRRWRWSRLFSAPLDRSPDHREIRIENALDELDRAGNRAKNLARVFEARCEADDEKASS